MELLSEDNYCGQSMLRLVSRGSSIITQLLRLSDFIPPAFLDTPPVEAQIYSRIISDFSYLKNADDYQQKIYQNSELQELDENFREETMEILERFYVLFESIYKYHADYIQFLRYITEGTYIEYSVQSLLQDYEGKKLMVQLIYLLGVMMLLLDMKIPSATREKLLISYYRYKGRAIIQNIDQICSLCKSTGFNYQKNIRPAEYPQSFFNRLSVPTDIVELIVGHLKDDDVYTQVAAYPAPDHRPTALSNQSSMLVVTLFFAPHILQSDQSKMREIVDKFFPDNWVIAFYLGFSYDLSQIWTPYNAAKSALYAYTMTNDNINKNIQKHLGKMKTLNKALNHYLKEGVMTLEFVLKNSNKMLNLMRECNITLKWLMQQRISQIKKVNEVVNQDLDMIALLQLIMNSSQFERVIKTQIEKILDQKDEQWNQNRYQSSIRMKELAEYFSGTRPLARGIQKNEAYQKWFSEIERQINGLNHNDPTSVSRKIQQLIQALQDVQQYHQIEGNLQIRQFLQETREYLRNMVNTANIQPSLLSKIARIADFSYAWLGMDDFLNLMQQTIKIDPPSVRLLQSTILKLNSILDVPIQRIIQSDSPDLQSVSEYYSTQLVKYVRKVLQVIPQAVFHLLDQISTLQGTFQQIPEKLKRETIKDFAFLNERHMLASLTHQISVFTNCVMIMENSFVGLIEVDPKQLLEDGIRRELVSKISQIFHTHLTFREDSSISVFAQKLDGLSAKLQSLRMAFEYIQDFLGLYGLKIWHQELSRVIWYNTYLQTSVLIPTKQNMENLQSVNVPIPRMPAIDDKSFTFMGRLIMELLKRCDQRRYIYIQWMNGWYDQNGNQIIGLDIMTKIHSALGVIGLAGLDKLLCAMVHQNLKTFCRKYKTSASLSSISQLWAEFQPMSSIPQRNRALYSHAENLIRSVSGDITQLILLIGQMQLIRRLIAYQMNFRGRIDSPLLWSSLKAVNQTVLNDIYSDKTLSKKQEEFLVELEKFMNLMGFHAVFEKIFLRPGTVLEKLPLALALITIHHMSNLRYDQSFACLVKKGNEVCDGGPLVAGILTIFKQFHANYLGSYLGYLGQFVAMGRAAPKDNKKLPDLMPDVQNTLMFIEELRKYAGFSRQYVENFLPTNT